MKFKILKTVKNLKFKKSLKFKFIVFVHTLPGFSNILSTISNFYKSIYLPACMYILNWMFPWPLAFQSNKFVFLFSFFSSIISFLLSILLFTSQQTYVFQLSLSYIHEFSYKIHIQTQHTELYELEMSDGVYTLLNMN